jgi:hypothetical protein
MQKQLDFTNEYKNKIRPEINRRLRNLLISLAAILILLVLCSEILDYFNLPDKLIFVLFFPCAALYLYQISFFKDIRCPNCRMPLFALLNIGKKTLIFKSHISKLCPNCGAKLR